MKSTPLLIFDLGNVLLDLAFGRFVQSAALISSRDARDIRERYIDGAPKGELERGHLSGAEFLREMAEWLGWPFGEIDSLETIWCDVFDRVPEAEIQIERFAHHHHLWLLSDTNELHWRYLKKQFAILKPFARYLLSYQNGVLKSDPGAFDDLVEAAGRPGDRILFFDDIPQNVEAARQAGLNAHLFVTWPQVERTVREASGISGGRT